MLEIILFKKIYPTSFGIEIKSLQLGQGVHLIQGKNGSGKSTLLKAIAGIHDFEGDVILEGLSIKKSPIAFRKLVNYSEAEPLFPDFLSMDELITFVTEIKKINIDQVQFLKEIFNIGDYSNNPFSTYSSGMVKKAGLILAFLGHPRLIILDEPFTTIDTAAQKRLTELIESERKGGVSFIITSHTTNLIELLKYDSVLRIDNGAITYHHEEGSF